MSLTIILKRIFTLMFFMLSGSLFAQFEIDTRYDSNMNLPFNTKGGDINPQTGNLSVSYTDVTLPGRAGMNFSFSRIWTLNQSNLFNMYLDSEDNENRLDGNTLDKFNGLGVGWSSNIPYIYDDISSGTLVKFLFLGGSVYEIDRNGIQSGDTGVSNLLWYDLTDKRVFKSTEVQYSQLSDYNVLESKYNLDKSGTEYSEYALVMADNSKYFFDKHGKLMMHQDKSGLNKIWYMYSSINNERRLALVVDSIGRKIRFNYDIYANLKEIEWDVEHTIINDSGNRELVKETRKVIYSYRPVENTVDYNNLRYNVSNLRTQFALETVTDTENNVTKFDYRQGKAEFTYDSSSSHSYNLFLLLTSVASNYTEINGAPKYRNKRVLEYNVPTDGLYKKDFYKGYMRYYKVTNSHYYNRHGKKVNNVDYTYLDEKDPDNYLKYTTEIKAGTLTSTYSYSLSSERDKFQTLSSVSVVSDDRTYRKLTEYTYDTERKKTEETVRMSGDFAYLEKFKFDINGNLLTFTDRNNLTTTTVYHDTYNIPKKITRSFKDRDDVDQLYVNENVVNDLGQVIEQKTHVKDGVITDATYTYDKDGNLIESKDALGNIVYTVYDTTYNAFPVKQYQNVTISSWGVGNVHDNWLTEPTATTTSTLSLFRVFNSDGSVWVEFDNAGNAVEHYYDRLGQEIETINPDADDDTGFLATLTNTIPFNYFRDNTAEYKNFISSRSNNPGARTFIDYHNDYIKTEVDFNKSQGGVKKNGVQRDGMGNVEEEIAYNSDDTVYSVKKMHYDSYGRMVALTDPDATGEPVDYDAGSHEIVNIDLYKKTWVVKYDQAGRKRKVLYPKKLDGRNDVKRISYNDVENSVTTTDPLGRTLYERKDWSGNTLEVKNLGKTSTPDSEKQTFLYEYDALNRKVKFTDPEKLVTKYVYDERNLLKEQIYYDTDDINSTTSSDEMFYNELGQLVYKVDRKRQVLHFDYDELKRNTSVKHYNSLADYEADKLLNYANPVREVKTDFDSRGNTVRVSSESLIEHFKYDFANRVEKLDRYIKDTTVRDGIASVTGIASLDQKLSFNYQYNDGGMVTSMFYPDGSVHTFNYDNSLGFLTSINESNGVDAPSAFINSLEYNLSGVVTKMNYSNNTSQHWSFDNRKRISQILVKGKDGSNLEELNYRLNGVGDVESINNEYFYQYDGLGRITGAQTLLPGAVDQLDLVKRHFGTYESEPEYAAVADIYPEGTPDGKIDGEDHVQATFQDVKTTYDVEEFTYDMNGNRITLDQNGDLFRYTYGKRNRLLSIHKKAKDAQTETLYAQYEYDDNGNTTRRTINGYAGTTITTFTYDTLNRLTSTTEGSRTVTYRYDNAGNRFIKTTPDKTTVYLRHGQIAVAMDIDINTDQTSKLGEINRYILSGDLTAGRVKTEKNIDLSIKIAKSYYHLDHLNSTKMVTDQNGGIEINYIYRAFGEQLKKLDKSGAETDNDSARYSYGGKELDADTNLYYFNARYYDATTGRFINVDPIQDGTNWYVYCANNPLNFVDPTGLLNKRLAGVLDGLKTAAFGGLEIYGGIALIEGSAALCTTGIGTIFGGIGIGIGFGMVVDGFGKVGFGLSKSFTALLGGDTTGMADSLLGAYGQTEDIQKGHKPFTNGAGINQLQGELMSNRISIGFSVISMGTSSAVSWDAIGSGSDIGNSLYGNNSINEQLGREGLVESAINGLKNMRDTAVQGFKDAEASIRDKSREVGQNQRFR